MSSKWTAYNRDQRTFKLEQEFWDRFTSLVGPRGASRAIKQFVLWYIREPGIEMPERPPVGVVEIREQ